MLLELEKILIPAQVDKIKGILNASEFVNGKLTAGSMAKKVKNNQEVKSSDDKMAILLRIVLSSLSHHKVFNSAVLPKNMSNFIFARYQAGMSYGSHIDDPIMGQSLPRLRSDVSMTIFLNDPDSYAGGELVLQTTFGEQKIKLPAGHAIIYPSSSLHRVAEVTAGERLVVLGWMQSHVRDVSQRELLFELNRARETLLNDYSEQEMTGLVDKSYANLVRMWSDV